MAGGALDAADFSVTNDLHVLIDNEQRALLESLLSEKTHAQQSRLSWLREPASRVGGRSLHEILDKIDLLRSTKYAAIKVPDNYLPRLAQMVREGARHTAQAFQQMGPARRLTTPVVTPRALLATPSEDRTSAVEGTRVSVRVDLGDFLHVL